MKTGSCKERFLTVALWVTGLFAAVSLHAQAMEPAVDSLRVDTSEVSDPEWYVAPEIPVSLRAPMRVAAAAASCTRVEAIQTFNIDSVLTEGTYYEYDAKGNVISTTVWTYNPDGTMTGKSKNEYAFDATGTQTMTAVYIWDGAANDWKGTEKYEYVYKTFAGEKKMTSSTSSVWLNGAWVADLRYTYDYDASAREISYFEYRRNTSTNELQPVKGREQSWTDDLQTLEALYTAYANGKWTAGAKKEWAFDGNGTQTMYATYTISNGAWVGVTKETWAYNTSSKLTLHEQYGWAGNDWSITLQENTTYDASGNTTLIENYSWSNGIKTGTKKEQYSFDGGKPVLTMVYAWSNGAWIGSSKEVWNYNASSKLTLHEKYGWTNNDWSLTLQEETVYSGANITLIENYTWSNGVKTGTKKEEYTYSGSLKTSFVTYSWAGSDWVGASKEIWAYTSGKQTLHETYAWGATDWSITLQENTAYSGANVTKIENYTWTNGTKTGTKKEEYTYSGSLKTSFVTYSWAGSDWVGTAKEVWGYTSGKQTLHETYEWYNDGWSVTLRELSGYDAAGNKNSIENYTGSEGVLTGTQKEEYTFNSAKEVIVTVKYKWSEGVWVGDTKNEVGYRDGNTEYSEANYTWDGSAWAGIGNKTVTEYYAEDKVSVAWAYAWSSVASDWVYAARRICEYDGKGRSIGDTIYTYSNGAWEYYKLQTHGFDSHDNDTLAVTATWNGAEWMATFIAKGTYTYTPSGDPLLVETYTGVEGSWVGDKKIIFEYNTKGSQTLYYEYEWKNGWINKKKTEKGYDSNNNLIFTQSYTWNGSTWKGSSRYEYSYDDYGFQNMSAHYVWIGGKWQGLTRTDKINSSEGVELSTISFSWENNGWVATLKTDYIRINDRIVEKLVSRYRNNQWQNYQRYIWNYDLYDREIFYSEERWKNENWQKINIKKSQYDEYCTSILRKQIEGSWNTSGIVLSYTDNHYFYDCDPHFYTVRFVNYDGQVLANMTAQEGETPTYVGSNPTREGNAEYSYTFSGWNPALAPVTANITYTATFTANKKTYTVTWKNEDGSVIESETLEYGATPAHADITKESTAEYTYTFAGWTPGIGIVTSDAEYTATFTQTKNSYLITFQNEDGTVLSSETYEYGAMPTIPTTPTKPADGANTYTFAGWDKEIVPVTEAATYTATYNATKNSYTITFADEDGMVLQSSEVEYGAMPTAPSDPTKANTAEWSYTFAGWTPQVETVTEAATYTATYDSVRNSYTVTWLNEDGSVIESETLEYGATPAHTDITKESTPEYTYTFAGWTPAVATVTGDATYTASFTATKNKYLVTFKDEDGTTLKSEELEYGVMPTAPSDPTKASTAEYTYAFNGWDKEIASVTEAAIYTATYAATKNSYTITFNDEDGSVISSANVEYGAMPVEPTAPTKPADSENTYTFAGWTPAVVAVTGEATYTATYISTTNSYTITFKSEDGTTISTASVEYGTMPVAPTDPTKQSTAEYTYTFSGWTPTIAEVIGDATYTASFTATKNKYLVTFKDEDGTVLKSEELEYGIMPTAPSDPTKANTAEWSYTFAGWNKEVVPVKEAATYTATYNATKNSYTITFADEDGMVLQSSEVEYGVTPVAPSDPTKANTAEWSYIFAGWTPQVEAVTGNAEYTATFTATKRTYTVNWLNEDGSVIESQTLEYGATPTHADITKESTAEYTYTFAGWTPQVEAVTGNAEYTATFTATERVENKTYTVTFYYEDGVTVLDQVTVQYGETPATSLIPSKYSEEHYYYTFSGWSPEVVPAEGNASYTATFKAVPKQYTVTFKNHNGRTLLTTNTPYGEIPEYTGDEPTRTKDKQYTYTFAGWSPELTEVTGPTTYTAVFEGTLNQYTVIFLDEDGTELDRQTLDYGVMPVYEGETPTKDDEGQYGYTFKGWSPKLTSVTKNATYRATYTRYDKTQGIGATPSDSPSRGEKVLRNGHIYILRGGKTYTLQGVEVR